MFDSKVVLTGTHVYGSVNENSDIDIVMRRKDAEELESELRGYGVKIYRTEIQEQELYSGYYFNLGILKFNIICAKTDRELAKWKYATEQMIKHGPIKDREERLIQFEKYFNELIGE